MDVVMDAARRLHQGARKLAGVASPYALVVVSVERYRSAAARCQVRSLGCSLTDSIVCVEDVAYLLQGVE